MRAKSPTIERGVRTIVASLLSSEMTTRDLRDFALQLVTDPSLGKMLGHSLLHTVEPVLDYGAESFSDEQEGEVSRALRHLLLERHYPTEEIIRVARAVAPSLSGWAPDKRRSKASVVSALLEAATERDRRELLRVLTSGGVSQDPFIRGLQDREKKP